MFIPEKNSLTQEIEELVNSYGSDRSSLLSILQAVQRKHRYVSDFAQQEIARLLGIHPVEVDSVISFYAFLNTEPKGRFIVRLCKTIVCDLHGKDNIRKAIERELGINVGETTADSKFTLEYANCMGLCDQGPAMAVNERVYTKITPEKAIDILKEIKV
jgi:NADH:ubiquinone oxidoreductase subunit E